MTSISEYAEALVVGTVEVVTAGKIVVRLLEESARGSALNSGTLMSFPRINSPLLIPSEYGHIVGLTTEVIEQRQRNVQDAGVVRIPISERRVTLLPLGFIRRSESTAWLERGLHVFPTVGDPVLLPTQAELAALTVTASSDVGIEIGHSVFGTRGSVVVDVNRMLTRHLAVLGNTGSGKSCSVVTILRATVEKAASRASFGSAPRIVVLDTNGEFAHSFGDLPISVRRLAVDPEPHSGVEQLRLPGWLWNSAEWIAFTEASAGVQAPYIRRSLSMLRNQSAIPDVHLRRIAVILSSHEFKVRGIIHAGPSTDFGPRQDEGRIVETLKDASVHLRDSADGDVNEALSEISSVCSRIESSSKGREYWNNVLLSDWEVLGQALGTALKCCVGERVRNIAHEDDPIPFSVEQLADLIELEALEDRSSNASVWTAPLLLRLRNLVADRQIAAIASASDDREEETFEAWLTNLLNPGQVTIVDLSLVPTNVLHLVVAVLTRLLFEAHQRYRRATGRVVPTVLVAEEAHHFLFNRSKRLNETSVPASDLCVQSFERIAREGRKLGLSLVLTSQRPGEVSETVLSQCNSFLVHRIVNDNDQGLIRRLIPDSLGSLVAELPALPARTAILMGWASAAPVLVEVNELASHWRPSSQDPPLLQEWSDPSELPLWNVVAGHWSRTDSRGKT